MPRKTVNHPTTSSSRGRQSQHQQRRQQLGTKQKPPRSSIWCHRHPYQLGGCILTNIVLLVTALLTHSNRTALDLYALDELFLAVSDSLTTITGDNTPENSNLDVKKYSWMLLENSSGIPYDSDWPRKTNTTAPVMSLIHVGKAGGMTLRSATSLMCRLKPQMYNTPEKIEECIHNHLPPRTDGVLAHAVQYYHHMHDINVTHLQKSTHFVLTLRHPVDRIISTFRYSHPQNCNLDVYKYKVVRPWGCDVQKRWHVPNSTEAWLYKQCFPSAAMEAFAQAIMSPYSNNNNHNNGNDQSFQSKCRWMARQIVMGKGDPMPAPHMVFNYEYYLHKTLQPFPNTPVLAVRTTQEWEDMTALDQALGGKGIFRKAGRVEAHGSSSYYPSPLSPEAYHKLCCVLHHEIVDIYIPALLSKRIVNLNATAKWEALEEVRMKCGISATSKNARKIVDSSWYIWQRQCQRRLDNDAKLLQAHLTALPQEHQQQP